MTQLSTIRLQHHKWLLSTTYLYDIFPTNMSLTCHTGHVIVSEYFCV